MDLRARPAVSHQRLGGRCVPGQAQLLQHGTDGEPDCPAAGAGGQQAVHPGRRPLVDQAQEVWSREEEI